MLLSQTGLDNVQLTSMTSDKITRQLVRHVKEKQQIIQVEQYLNDVTSTVAFRIKLDEEVLLSVAGTRVSEEHVQQLKELLFADADATIPRITIVTRKAHNDADDVISSECLTSKFNYSCDASSHSSSKIVPVSQHRTGGRWAKRLNNNNHNSKKKKRLFERPVEQETVATPIVESTPTTQEQVKPTSTEAQQQEEQTEFIHGSLAFSVSSFRVRDRIPSGKYFTSQVSYGDAIAIQRITQINLGILFYLPHSIKTEAPLM